MENYTGSILIMILKIPLKCSICCDLQATQPKDKLMPHVIPWETVDANIFMLNKKAYLCVEDYQSKFLVVMQIDGLIANCLIKTYKIMTNIIFL